MIPEAKKIEFTPVAEDVKEVNVKLSKKNFDLARSLAAAQRRMSDQEANINEIRSRQERWVQDMQGDLAFVCMQLVSEQAARLEQYEPVEESEPIEDGDVSAALRRAREIREKLKKYEAGQQRVAG